MPLKLQACHAGKKVAECCVNGRGTGAKCGPCPRCKYTETRQGRLWRCKNTSCMDAGYCWVHLMKKYGVRIKDGQFGKSLWAAKDFKNGDIIAPLGGREEGNWMPSGTTGSYSYDFDYPVKVEFHKRPGEPGFKDLKGHWRNVRWPEVSKKHKITSRERHLRRALTIRYRNNRQRIFLVHDDDWPAYEEQAYDRGTKKDYHKNWDPYQFEAYVDLQYKKTPMDATCFRRAGSYANDAIDLRTGNENLERVNAEIIGEVMYPLRIPTGWLFATEDIPKGSEILVSYGPKYWSEDHLKQKTYPVHISEVPKTSKAKLVKATGACRIK